MEEVGGAASLAYPALGRILLGVTSGGGDLYGGSQGASSLQMCSWWIKSTPFPLEGPGTGDV